MAATGLGRLGALSVQRGKPAVGHAAVGLPTASFRHTRDGTSSYVDVTGPKQSADELVRAYHEREANAAGATPSLVRTRTHAPELSHRPDRPLRNAQPPPATTGERPGIAVLRPTSPASPRSRTSSPVPGGRGKGGSSRWGGSRGATPGRTLSPGKHPRDNSTAGIAAYGEASPRLPRPSSAQGKAGRGLVSAGSTMPGGGARASTTGSGAGHGTGPQPTSDPSQHPARSLARSKSGTGLPR